MKKKKVVSAPRRVRCKGEERRGGAFTLGPVTWARCENEAAVLITFKQDPQLGGPPEGTMPACLDRWHKAINYGIEIISVIPIPPGYYVKEDT